MRQILFISLILSGCIGGRSDDTDTDQRVEDGCAPGLDRPGSGQVLFGQFLFDGVSLSLGFNNTRIEGGRPSACVGKNQVEMLTYMGEQPFAWFTFETKEPGAYDVGGNGIFLEIDVIGANNPTLFNTSDFTTGTWTIYSSGDIENGDITNATGFNNEHSISFNMSYEFKP